MKLAISTVVALLATLLGLTLTAVAIASPKHSSNTANAEKVYRSELAQDRAELKVKVGTLEANESRAEASITPCLSKAFVPIFKEVDAKPTKSSDKAVALLGVEAGAEFESAALKPVIAPELSNVRSLLGLGVPSAERTDLKRFLPAYLSIQSLNTCADARAWYVSDLAAAKEPKGTKRAATALTAIYKATKTPFKPDYSGLTPAQLRTVKLERTRTIKHTTALVKQADASLKSWITKLTRSVQTLTATQTSTTATPTTTTATQTTSTPTQTTATQTSTTATRTTSDGTPVTQ